jgi:hypothetical protein
MFPQREREIKLGEAKVKRRAHAAVLEKYPWCIYCGGVHRADTIEHMPPVAMFDARQRPKGLEFPTCRDCNNGTGKSDLVASLLGRVYPDAKVPEDLKKLLRGVRNNVPGLLEEMHLAAAARKFAWRDVPNMPPGAGLLRTNGPILTKHIHIFGAKLGFALHYETHGSPVPPEGGVQSMFFTNVNAMRGELPMELIGLLGAPQTLKQGIREVSDQFQYSWRLTEEKRHSLFYAVFRSSFALAAVSALDRSEILAQNADKYPVAVPGEFKKCAQLSAMQNTFPSVNAI